MKLISIKQGLYPGYIRDYNIKTSNRTGKKYLNLNLQIDTFKQEADVQKSYCLDIGYNLSIIELMEEVGGLDKSGNADFEKLYDHEFMVGIYYNDFGQLITDKIYTILSYPLPECSGWTGDIIAVAS